MAAAMNSQNTLAEERWKRVKKKKVPFRLQMQDVQLYVSGLRVKLSIPFFFLVAKINLPPLLRFICLLMLVNYIAYNCRVNFHAGIPWRWHIRIALTVQMVQGLSMTEQKCTYAQGNIEHLHACTCVCACVSE